MGDDSLLDMCLRHLIIQLYNRQQVVIQVHKLCQKGAWKSRDLIITYIE